MGFLYQKITWSNLEELKGDSPKNSSQRTWCAINGNLYITLLPQFYVARWSPALDYEKKNNPSLGELCMVVPHSSPLSFFSSLSNHPLINAYCCCNIYWVKLLLLSNGASNLCSLLHKICTHAPVVYYKAWKHCMYFIMCAILIYIASCKVHYAKQKVMCP